MWLKGVIAASGMSKLGKIYLVQRFEEMDERGNTAIDGQQEERQAK